MKVAGFSFIKDAITYDYPVVEALQSILPLCDQVYVAVGKSGDDTLALIRSIHPEKIVILETVWDETLREGGRVLAVETDKAFQAIPDYFDWCIYIQGDEVIHEQYHDEIKKAMLSNLNNNEVDGLLFHYLHFYASYDYVIASSNFYKKEIRIVRNDKSIFSYRDAQGFRKKPNEKLNVKPLQAYIYHYGWVKQPKAMQAKQLNFNKYWHDDDWVQQHVEVVDEFDYGKVRALNRFNGTHPKVIQSRISKMNWTFSFDPSKRTFSFKDLFKKWLFHVTGVDLNYKNYRNGL